LSQEFKYLFSPLKIRNVTIPNRILFSAHACEYFPPFAPPNERALHYWAARAKGGTGLITTGGHFTPWMTTAYFPTAYESDSVIPALKQVTDAIHEHGTKCFFQINHGGNMVYSRMLGGGSSLSASPVTRGEIFCVVGREVPHEMDKDDMKRVIEAYSGAARRAREAGYDGVEIMAANAMLYASFLSPATNHRTDEYGGSIENRMRFLLETIDAIREKVGSDFVLGVRFTGDELIDGGIGLEEAKEIAKRLEATGKVDYLFTCAGALGPVHVPPMYYPLAAFVYVAAAIKEVVSLPVFTVGRINDPVIAERILADNQADMIGMTRANICDPEMPNKAREGRLDEIRRCLGCSEGCSRTIDAYLPTTCVYNPEAGREQEFAITPATNKKSVMVIGGGAAGLETARVAAIRGHNVTLYEKNDILAKELVISTKAPGRDGFEDAVRYYTNQMKLLGVAVHLGVTVTPEMVLKEKPDAVVVATGAVPYIPDIPGADGKNVVEVRQVLQDEVEVGQNVVIADYQNHILGLETAEFLADRGAKVELLTGDAFAGGRSEASTLEILYSRVLNKGVVITTLTKVREIKGNTVVAYNVFTNVDRYIEGVDTIVFATDGKANDSLYRSLKGKVKELYEVGQCVSPRKLLESVYDGAVVGRKL
jgi:mycofactocin system FadH/OYE family oxidoreductase 2